MSLKYAFFHWGIHLILVLLISLSFGLGPFNFFLAFVSAGLIDIDHLPRILKKGLLNWTRESMQFHVKRKYPLHNFFTILIFSFASLLVLSERFFSLGICSFSVATHLIWDLFEDRVIFKMGIKHWRI